MRGFLVTIFFSVLSFHCLHGQTAFRILPEAGLSLPTGDFKSKYTYGSQGYLAGLNLDMFWGKFGVGLYGGINNIATKYQDDLPLIGGLISSKINRINKESWNQFIVGLGPIYKLGLSEKFDLELSLKVGVSKFTYPDYGQNIQTGAPLNKRYLIFDTRNQDVKDKLNLATIPGMRLNFKPSEKLVISLGANYTSSMGVQHSYSFLDGGFNPEMSDEQLVSALRVAPMVTNVYKCTFNSFGIALGVGYTFGGKDKPKDDPKEKMDPPIPQYPEDGSTITPEEADSLVLKWVKETPKVEKANYNFWLYEVRDTTEKEDTLIYQTKVNRQQEFLLPKDVKLENGMTYRWKVQAIEARELKPCPGDCYSLFAKFQVGSGESVFYELLAMDVGNYVEAGGQLRVNLPKNIYMQGKVGCRIFNAQNEEVLKVENLLPDNRSAFHSTDEQGRVTLSLRGLPEGFYRLEVQDEQHRIYFLRFKIGKTIGHEKY